MRCAHGIFNLLELCDFSRRYGFLFYLDSRWSVKCKTFAPGYAKVAKTMKEKNPKIKIAKVNASKEKKLAKTFNIEEYPTIIYFRRGTQVRYEGQFNV